MLLQDLTTGRMPGRVAVAHIDVDESWMVPAKLRVGGVNAHPPAGVHVAVLRWWGARFGARLVGLTHEALEVHVVERPETWAEAFALAQEHLDYCPNIIEPGMTSLRDVAARLKTTRVWSFFWL